MDSLRELWDGLDPFVTTSIGVVAILLAAIVAKRVVVRLLRRAYASRIDRIEASDAAELSRIKRQKTLATTLESLIRYGIYGAAIVIAIGLVTGGRSSAFFGASVVAVLIGFGLQRLFGDVLAGALLLFEGHFAVGDVITVHQHNVTGVVEEFALRTTSLRTLAGDRVTIMNGGIVSLTRWSYGQCEHRIELLLRSEADVERLTAVLEAEGTAPTALWVRPPRIDTAAPVDGGLVRIVASGVTAPGHDALVTRLQALVEALLEDSIVGPVTALAHHRGTFEPWRRALLVRDA